jgi:hypothetical protein
MSVNQQTEIARRLIAEWKARIAEGILAEPGCTCEEFEEAWPKYETEFWARETEYARGAVARYLREGVLIFRDN